MPTVLAFDIGIKNLAYCVYDTSANQIIALENVNLIPSAAAIICHLCAKPINATYESALGPTCKRHIPKTHPILVAKDIKALKDAAKAKGLKHTGLKAELVTTVQTAYSLPLVKVKEPKAAAQSLESLHDALRAFAHRKWDLFKTCDAALLENQPAFKNPHMKSVQVLLFATLRELFVAAGQPVQFRLVHAKKKVEGAEAGDAGYAERKRGSEERVEALFATVNATEAIRTMWQGAKKKSDMADAVCMCVDFAA
jgi:hypothetical protein